MLGKSSRPSQRRVQRSRTYHACSGTPSLSLSLTLSPTHTHTHTHTHRGAVFRYLIANVTADFADVPDIPRGALELLQKHYVRTTSSVEKCQTSADKQTTKLLITLQDGLQCEAVIMHYDTTGAAGFPPALHTCLLLVLTNGTAQA